MMLVAILGLSAIELTSQYLESGWVRTAAEQVVGALQQARQYAIANAATYTVTLTGSSLAVACTAGCPPSAPNEPATPLTGGATTSPTSLTITFDAMGCANSVVTPCDTGTTQTVTISYPGATSWQVRVSPSGRIRACSPSCA